jgi:hypothetical protein
VWTNWDTLIAIGFIIIVPASLSFCAIDDWLPDLGEPREGTGVSVNIERS